MVKFLNCCYILSAHGLLRLHYLPIFYISLLNITYVGFRKQRFIFTENLLSLKLQTGILFNYYYYFIYKFVIDFPPCSLTPEQ
jgi:hypothetical protein